MSVLTSIVIVNYNTKDLLVACLKSIAKQQFRHEVIVVDNASVDGSAEHVRQYFPKVTLIANDQNVGFAAANNQAFRVATGEYVMMLNSDAELPDPATEDLAELMSYLATHPKTGVVAPRLINGGGHVQQSAAWRETGLGPLLLEYTMLNRLLYKLLPNRRYPGKLLLSPHELRSEQSVGDLLGACLVFRRSLLDQVGRLDERFFIFLEETDFNLRVRRAGYELRYLPQVTVVHHWGGSIDSAGSLRKRYALYFPSLYAFFRKQHGSLYALAAYAEALLGSGLAAALIGGWWLISLPVSLIDQGKLRQKIVAQWPVVAGILRWHLGMRAA